MSGPDPSLLPHARLLKLVQDLRASYWFIPVVMVLVAICASSVMLWLDRSGLPRIFAGTRVEGARSTLSVIATSVIGVAGVMFSMTVVAVSFAAGNFGPRLIGNFMRDRGNQISMGMLVSIYVYCLMVLRAVESPLADGSGGFVPQYSLLLALGLALVAVVTMILFVHHIPETINVSNITAGLGKRLSAAILEEISRKDAPDAGVDWTRSGPATKVYLNDKGYVQALDLDLLQNLAASRDWLVEVHQGPGRFVTPQRCVLSVIAPGPLVDADHHKLRDAFAVGDSRREAQNIDFLLDQLIEMIARAMSPGVNDPYTAITCLNWIAASLSVALVEQGGLRHRPLGRVAMEPVTFQALFTRAFGNSLPYLKDDALCLRHVHELLEGLAGLAEGADRRLVEQMLHDLPPVALSR